MTTLSYQQFLKTLPPLVMPRLRAIDDRFRAHQPWRWLLQFHTDDKRIHYEVSRPRGRSALEIGLHCESRDKALNQHLLMQFDHQLIALKDALGDSIEAEMWDRGWTKVYDIVPISQWTESVQADVATRLVDVVRHLHPVLIAEM